MSKDEPELAIITPTPDTDTKEREWVINQSPDDVIAIYEQRLKYKRQHDQPTIH